MTSTAEVESLLADHSDAVAGIARLLRRTLLDGHPPLVERVRTGWHSVNYHDPAAGFVCAVFPFADRVQLIFERGTELPDPEHRLTGSGRRVRALEFADEGDVDPEMVLEFLDHALDVGARVRSR
ncbi:DUF1801 domain-containing protein [Blastococcus sp. CT_GayMR20]|uniref:DUF1801 domain-containing protein n=1 Tax=Blastococcus sp. CT_GayMR20 TaxID=2559609 RepID=UPI0010730CC4|nr:DUF1801 domain-containing protein [Blastococcus sp. CT_GayMR20]TFV88076.1 DUF1801 domain-containing protein [Blastococcus sp. CT_GayMR20]